MRLNSETAEKFHPKKIAVDTIYNLLGLLSPLLFAVFLLPFIISSLGNEKFGLLSLCWVFIGYFSLFDFGIGRALTKVVSEKIATKHHENIAGIFWTSMLLIFSISVIGSVVVWLLNKFLVFQLFNISARYTQEASKTFYLLAIAIPIVTTNSALRGFLEAYHEFGKINVLRSFLGILMFLGPVITLFFSDKLYVIVFVLICIRIIFWTIYLLFCFKRFPALIQSFRTDKKSISYLLRLSSWMTVSNFISPLMTYIDRFLIATIISVTAVTFYSTPYEVITRFLVFATGICGVLFPSFSASFVDNKDISRKMYLKGVKYISLLLFPIIFISILYASQGLNIWLGKDFAIKSGLILQLIAFGVFFNSIAQIPFTFLQGIGKPDITAKIHLIELPLYMVAIFLALKNYGINGAAAVWSLRVVLDAILLFIMSLPFLGIGRKILTKLVLSELLLSSVLCVSFFIKVLELKIIFSIIILTVFILLTWKVLIDQNEKNLLKDIINGINPSINLNSK